MLWEVEIQPKNDVELRRVRAGYDASCLNLYRPDNPRIVAPTSTTTWPCAVQSSMAPVSKRSSIFAVA